MNADEILRLTYWIDDEIKGRKIVSLYTQLVDILQNNANSTPSRPFSSEKEELKKALRAVDLQSLTNEQLELLSRLGVASAVGLDGVNALDEILVKAGLDISTAWTMVSEARDRVQKGIERSNQIRKSLDGLIDQVDGALSLPRIRVRFSGDAAISNIVDLKKWAGEWHDIGRGIAMSQGVAPEEISVVSAHRGSIIITLAASYGVVKIIAEILLRSLEVAQKTLDIKKTAEEIRSLRLANDKIAKELEDQISAERDVGIQKISGEIVAASSVSSDHGDRITALESSVKKLVSFLEKGGHVDLLLPEIEEEANEEELSLQDREIKELRARVHQIRLLEANVKLLEQKSTRKVDS
jgi:hypothetical protein